MIKFLISLSFILPLSAQAIPKYNGSVTFSKAEKARHSKKIREFKTVAADCINDYKKKHLEFYEKTCAQGKCLSKFYGSRRYSKKRGKTRADGKPLQYLGDALKEAGFPVSYMDQMESTSCIGMAMKCLGKAFVATGQKEQWKKMKYFVSRLNNTYGTALLHALQQIGWNINYWNPTTDTDSMKEWHQQELGPVVSADSTRKKLKTTVDGKSVYRARWDSIGRHYQLYKTVMREDRYWYNKIDNKTDMVGFGSGSPRVLKETPFWVGLANVGYHVFPGTYSDVIEAHSTRHITSRNNMEFSTFAPFAKGGGPRWSPKEKYRSGLIATPPR